MRKILIVAANEQERSDLEEILYEVIEQDGELIFAGTKRNGLEMAANEKPQLVFLDAQFADNQEEWKYEGVHIVVMGNQNERGFSNGDFLLKPLKPLQILEKCNLALAKAPAAPIRPM